MLRRRILGMGLCSMVLLHPNFLAVAEGSDTKSIIAKEVVVHLLLNLPWKDIAQKARKKISENKEDRSIREIAIQTIVPDAKILLGKADLSVKAEETNHMWCGSVTVTTEALYVADYAVNLKDVKFEVLPKNKLITIRIPPLTVNSLTESKRTDSEDYSGIRILFAAHTRKALRDKINEDIKRLGNKEAGNFATSVRPEFTANLQRDGQKLLDKELGLPEFLLRVE